MPPIRETTRPPTDPRPPHLAGHADVHERSPARVALARARARRRPHGDTRHTTDNTAYAYRSVQTLLSVPLLSEATLVKLLPTFRVHAPLYCTSPNPD